MNTKNSQLRQKQVTFCDYGVLVQGYSGSDIRLVCKEAAMKPLRRLMTRLEQQEQFNNINWFEQADPAEVPQPGPVTQEDFLSAIQSTKSAAQIIKFEKYEAWMEKFGSV